MRNTLKYITIPFVVLITFTIVLTCITFLVNVGAYRGLHKTIISESALKDYILNKTCDDYSLYSNLTIINLYRTTIYRPGDHQKCHTYIKNKCQDIDETDWICFDVTILNNNNTWHSKSFPISMCINNIDTTFFTEKVSAYNITIKKCDHIYIFIIIFIYVIITIFSLVAIKPKKSTVLMTDIEISPEELF